MSTGKALYHSLTMVPFYLFFTTHFNSGLGFSLLQG